MASSCGSGPGGVLCRVGDAAAGAVGGAVSSAARYVVNMIGQALATAADGMLHSLTSIWMGVDTPQLTGLGSPVTSIQNGTQWITVLIAVTCVVVAGGRMAVRRRGEPMSAMTLGLVRLVVVSAGSAWLVELAGKASDEFTTALMNAAHFSTGWGAIVSVTTIATTLASGGAMVIIVALLVLLSALVQLMLMILRIGLLVILTGTLPLAAAASMSDWGETWWRKHLGWLVAWLLYKPAAALLFAGAIALTRGKSLVEVTAGFMLLCLMVMLLPALLKMIVPATSALGARSGGPLALATVGAVATGAIRIAQASSARGQAAGGSTAGRTSPTGGDPPTGASNTAGNPTSGSPPAEAGGQAAAPSGAPAGSPERSAGDSPAPSGSSDTPNTPPRNGG